MWFFAALLIVSFPAWWLGATISYFFEFYHLAAGFTVVGCASLLLALKVAGPKFGRREKYQDILLETAAGETNEIDTAST